MEQMRAYDPFDAIKNYIMEYRGNMSSEAIQKWMRNVPRSL